MRAVLGSARLRRYLAAQVLSLFGDTAMYLALGVWVKALTGSSSAAGMVFFAVMLPSLTAPVAGLVVDRVRRRPLLVVTNLATAVAVLPLLAMRSAGDVWIAYVVAVLYGISSTLLMPAQTALLSVLVPGDRLGEANGVLQTAKELLRLLGPLAGAGLYAWWGSGAPVVLLDAATFALAALLLLTVRTDEPAPVPVERRWRHEMTAGAAHVFREPVLRRIVLAAIAVLSVTGMFETLIYVVTDRGLHRPPAFIAVLSAAQGVGAVAGGAVAATVLRRLGESRLVGAGMAFAAVGLAAVAAPSLPVVLGGSAVVGFGVPWLSVGLVTALQRRTPSGVQGRAMAAVDVLLNGPMTVSIAAGAGLVAIVDYRVLIAVAALVVAGAAAYLWRGDRRAVDVRGDGQAAVGEPVEPAEPVVLAAPGQLTDA